MILLDKYVKFITTHKLTERQMLILLLVYYKREDLIGLYKKTYDVKILITKENKEVLYQRGFLITDDSGNNVLTKKFKDYFIDKDIATDEIFDIYPVSMMHNGITIPLKGMDRSIFANLYIMAIMGSIDEHQEVIKDIEYGKVHNMLNIGIEKFLKSKYWLGIRKARLENKTIIDTKTLTDNEF